MKKISRIIAIIMACSFLVVAFGSSNDIALAADETTIRPEAGNCGNKLIFGFRPWYYKIATGSDADCKVSLEGEGEEGVVRLVWQIVANILVDVTLFAAIASVAFVMYAGFKYMTSSGSSEGIVKAKKTLQSAIIGLLITIFASAILNTVFAIIGV